MPNPLVPKDGVWRVSAHKLNMMRKCPFSLYLYLSRFPSADSDRSYLSCGNAVHDYAEELTKGCAKEPEYYLGKYEVPQLNSDGVDIHKRFYTCIENVPEYALQEGGIPERTEYTSFTTPKGRNCRLETRIDLQLEDSQLKECKGKVIVDYKTGSHVKNNNEYKLQAQCYLFAKKGEYKALFVSMLNPSEYFVIDSSPADYIPKLCDEYIDTVLMHDFERKMDFNCPRFCPYYQMYCKDEYAKCQQLIVPEEAQVEAKQDDSEN